MIMLIYFIEKQCFINANYLLLSHVIHFLQENTKTANNFLPLSKSGSIFITLSSDLQRQLLYLNANQEFSVEKKTAWKLFFSEQITSQKPLVT